MAIAPRQAVLWAYLTRPLVCVAKNPEDGPPYPQVEPNIFESGETRTVKMKTVKPGRKLIKRALKKGKRKLPGGDWEVFRPDVPGEITFETGDLKKIKLRG